MAKEMNVIADWDKIPTFAQDREEAEFWRRHRPGVRLMENSLAIGSMGNESVTITLRMDPRMLSRIKRLARSRFLNYQSMIKQWLSERMEQEQRLQRNGHED
jgi:predicted DNA binding CopG/RHH family protein